MTTTVVLIVATIVLLVAGFVTGIEAHAQAADRDQSQEVSGNDGGVS